MHKENEWHKSERKIIENNKSQNHHIWSFLKDWLKWTAFAALTAIGAGLLIGIFLTPPIATMAAALVAVVTFIGVSSYGFYRADLNNVTTTEFTNNEFVTESGNIFFRLKQRFNILRAFFNRKLTNTSDLPIVNGNNLAKTVTAGFISTSSNSVAELNELPSTNTCRFFSEVPTIAQDKSNKPSLLRSHAS